MPSKGKEPKRAEWTEDEENAICRAAVEGLGPTAIASLLKFEGRTVQQVVNKVGNLRPTINVFKAQVACGRMSWMDICPDSKYKKRKKEEKYTTDSHPVLTRSFHSHLLEFHAG
jgi:hypothetical protein